MQENGAAFNFTLGGGNVTENGVYFVEGHSNLDEPFITCFEVNQTGIQFDNLWLNFILVFAFTFGAFTLIYIFNESKNTIMSSDGNFVYYYLGAFMLFSVGIYTIIFGFGGYKTILTEAYGWIVWGSGLLFLTKPYYVGGLWKW